MITFSSTVRWFSLGIFLALVAFIATNGFPALDTHPGSDTVKHQTRTIHYCADHGGVATTTEGFLWLSRSFVCKDGTTEDDRGDSEDVPITPQSAAHS